MLAQLHVVILNEEQVGAELHQAHDKLELPKKKASALFEPMPASCDTLTAGWVAGWVAGWLTVII